MSFVKQSDAGCEKLTVQNSSLIKAKTCLHAHFKKKFVHNSNDCVKWCDSIEHCAAANFIESTSEVNCFLFKYGFTESKCDSRISYTKQAILDDPGVKNLPKEFLNGQIISSTITQSMNEYLNTLTPLKCFEKCSVNVKCTGASFELDHFGSNNCGLEAAFENKISLGSRESESMIVFIKNKLYHFKVSIFFILIYERIYSKFNSMYL